MVLLSFQALALFSAFLAVVGLGYIFLFFGRRGKNYPDGECEVFVEHIRFTSRLLTPITIGPPTLPVIGNIHQIPRKGSHFVYGICHEEDPRC